MTLEKDEGLVSNLTEFEKLSVKTISPSLDDYLKSISKTGDTCYNWNIVKPLLVYKLERVLDDFMETVTENGDESAPSSAEFQATKDRLLGSLNGFYRAPFTVQRMLELLLEPNKHYKKFDKYSRGLEKVLSVVTTVDPFPKKSPSSLLPNTVLNGNGLMRTVDDFGKKPKPLVNGEMEFCLEENKKRANGSDDRSPKRPRMQESSDMEPDSMVSTETPDSECFESNDNEITWNNVSEEKDKEENEQTDCTEEEAELPVVTVTPDSTTNDSDDVSSAGDSPKPIISQIRSTESEVTSPDQDLVSTTTSPSGEETKPETSLSEILSDHPCEQQGREG